MKFVYELIFFFTIVTLMGFVESTNYLKCDASKHKSPPPKSLRVYGCRKLPCKVYRGYNATAEIDFVVDKDTNKLKPQVYATVSNVKIPYPLPQKDGCTTLLKSQCPLDAGEEATFVFNMYIENFYPKISVLIEFSLLDQNDDVVVCYNLPIKVEEFD